MNRQRYVSPVYSSKPSKLPMLVAIVVACVLPYVVLSTFSAKNKSNTVAQHLDLPEGNGIQVAATPPVPQPVHSQSAVAAPSIVKDPWVTVTTRSGDSMAKLFKRVGLSGKDLHAVMNHNPYAKELTRIKPKQTLKFLIKNKTLQQLIYQITESKWIDIMAVKGQYRSIMHAPKMETRDSYLTATVQYSLYGTAKRQNIPYKLIQQMMEIFKWEINFAKDVRGGDQFSIIYKANYLDNQLVATGDIIAVSYTNRGVTYQALRHVSASGEVDYYTPKGKSLKQGFSRYPVKFSRINSKFSLSRMHPILHYNRPHKGIDLAAPMGSPIYATGDGRVDMMGYENGYGNVIKIVHHNKLYTSVYAHLLKFQKGLFRGSYVKRGQVIGFVGKSGLASGPHCHYEFHVNHHPKNPTTVPLPHAMPVPSSDLAAFKKNADKLIEHLKLFEQAHLASKDNRAVG